MAALRVPGINDFLKSTLAAGAVTGAHGIASYQYSNPQSATSAFFGPMGQVVAGASFLSALAVQVVEI